MRSASPGAIRRHLLWSIGLRSASLTRFETGDALWVGHSLIKTFGPRGTVHLLPAHHLPQWIGALSAIPPSQRGHTDEVHLTPEQTNEVVKTIAAALADAELTIDELGAAVVASTGPRAGERVVPASNDLSPRCRMALAQAGFRGGLCLR